MKRVLIVSPYFPPTNAADMQRIRMSLSYFEEFGWEAEVVTVDPLQSHMPQDPLLPLSVPAGVPVHQVDAFSTRWTRKLGLGSLALRSYFFLKHRVTQLLKQRRFDLVYFSTTEFPVCTLGAYWKRRFGVPYVIDMQDPWHSDYYQSRPRHERPPKYWFSYRLNKYLEPLAMKKVGGLIAVSGAYIRALKTRYPAISEIPEAVIPFGGFQKDFDLLNAADGLQPAFEKTGEHFHLVYVGRGGKDMREALEKLFGAFAYGLRTDPALFGRVRFHFIGTSYAPQGQGTPTIAPVADACGVSDYVMESTDRIPFYQGLKTLQAADGFVIPGSNDPAYTASKLYPYIMAQKPLLGIFHEQSSVVGIVNECRAGGIVTLQQGEEEMFAALGRLLRSIAQQQQPATDWTAFEQYTARTMCRRQVAIFNQVVAAKQQPQTN